MPRTKKQFEAMRLATREKIREAAIELFARKGPAGTSVQEIADAAGISIGLLYRHYKTKENLFDEMVDMARQGLEEVTAAFEADGAPEAIVRTLTSEIVSDLAAGNGFSNYIMVITQAIGSGAENDTLAALVKQDKKMLCAMESLIQKGQLGGTFRQGNAKDLALLFASAIQGISQFKMLLGQSFEAPSVESLAGILLA